MSILQHLKGNSTSSTHKDQFPVKVFGVMSSVAQQELCYNPDDLIWENAHMMMHMGINGQVGIIGIKLLMPKLQFKTTQYF